MFEILKIFYNVIAPIFLIAGLGLVVDRRFNLDTRGLSQIVVYLASPALVFSSISRSSLAANELKQLVLFTFIIMVVVAGISWFIARLLRLESKLASAFTLSSTLINAGNFGIPFIAFAFGDEGIGQAIIIYTATAIVTNTLGIFLASTGSASIKDSLLNIFKVPLIYAVLLGLLANTGFMSTPAPIEKGLRLLGDSAVPLMLIILGAQLSRTKLDGQLSLVALASGVRIIVVPVLGLIVAKLLVIGGSTASISIIQTSMPTAVVSIILAEKFGSDAKFVSSVVLVSTLASFFSLSILLSLLT
jgi:hypothetical protein